MSSSIVVSPPLRLQAVPCGAQTVTNWNDGVWNLRGWWFCKEAIKREYPKFKDDDVIEIVVASAPAPKLQECPRCDGTGLSDGWPCSACAGTGKLEAQPRSTRHRQVLDYVRHPLIGALKAEGIEPGDWIVWDARITSTLAPSVKEAA